MLFWYKLKRHGDSITMEIPASKLREPNGKYYTLTNNRLEKISAQLGDKIKVMRIMPDTIYVDFAEKLKRKLRVKHTLGSGSARGWAHIGVICALEAAGIQAELNLKAL